MNLFSPPANRECVSALLVSLLVCPALAQTLRLEDGGNSSSAVEGAAVHNGANIDTALLNPQSLLIGPFAMPFTVPQRWTIVSPRVDYKRTGSHALSFLYQLEGDDIKDSGVGSLNFQPSETGTFGGQLVNQASQLRSATLLPPHEWSLRDTNPIGAMQTNARRLSQAELSDLQGRAEQGDAIAQNNLAYQYTSGQSLRRDYPAAVKWYAAAAAQGLSTAQYNLGALYEHGIGLDQDYAKAAAYYRTAAEHGHVFAQARMGFLYESGFGVARNFSEAMRWYRAAAEQGDAGAQCNVGNGYYAGRGVPRDYSEAASWYRKAAEQEFAAAQNNLGALYHHGQGVKTDYNEALYWYRKAAGQGLPGAENNLGVMYEDGLGVSRDYRISAKWFAVAAEHGDTQGQYNLATLYRTSKGVPLDYVSAYFWYSLAASAGRPLARQALKDLTKVMTLRQVQEAETRVSTQHRWEKQR